MAMDSRELDSPLVDLDALADLRDVHDDLHIQAAVGSDRDSPSSLKRAGCDLAADADQSTAKKRRKQSKPVRIGAGGTALPGITAAPGDDALGDALGEVLGDVVGNGGGPVSPSLDLEVQVHCQTEAEAREEIPLNLCSLPKTEPSSPTGLDDFPASFASTLAAKAGSPGLDVDADRLGLNNFWGMSPPFLYPMMAPQADQTQALPPGLPQGLPQGLPPGLPQGLPQGLTGSNNHQSRCSPDNRTGSCTIFNPDAYCELCNKEFCNKYFLKTHKANKHGIFTSSPSQQPQQGQQQQSSPSSNDAYQHGLLPPRTLSPNSENQVKLGSSPIRLPKDLVNAKHSKNLFQRKIKVKSFGSNGDDVSLMTPPVDRVKIEDEYYDTDVDRLLSRMSPQSDGLVGMRTSERDEIAPPSKGLSAAVAAVAALHEEGGEGGSAGDSNESTGILRKEAQPPQEIPDKPVFTPEKMRSLGVINPEAFCEICCKEYCNKYFLRTHKWKRHGIAPPEGEQADKESQRSAAAPTWLQQLQQHAAPLNLIMEEASNQASSQHGDAICKFCGQWFPSEQVLQVHVAFVHLPAKTKDKDADLADIINSTRKQTEAQDGEKQAVDRSSGGQNRNSGDGRKAEQIESIMDDMKKVQTMLFQLNTLNANQIPGVPNEEKQRSPSVPSGPAEDQATALTAARGSPSSTQGLGLACSLCKKNFPDKNVLQQHMQDQHWNGQTPQVKADPDAPPAPPPPPPPQQQQPGRASEGAAQDHRGPEQAEPKPVASAPTSSYCEICNKELCNKYFMKTHMQRMHGIEIENGSQIGGVVCDICNKELCSKYFLRVHKQNTHGIVDEANGPPTQVRGDAGGSGGSSAALFNMAGGAHFLDGNPQALKPTDLSEMSHRYFTHFNEVCSICNRRFRSVKWLKAHLMNDHGRSEYEAAAEANDRLPKLQPGLHPNDLGVQLGLGPGLGAGLATMPTPRERSRGSEGKSRGHRASADAHSAKNGNHFMSNLMQQSSKEYRCSYCPFSTPVLAFLYVHEKTHTGLTYLPDKRTELQCPICFKAFTKPEQFQRHLLSHQFAGLPGVPGPGALFAGLERLDPRAAVYAGQVQQQQGHHKEAKQREKPPPPPRITPEREDDMEAGEERLSNRFGDPGLPMTRPRENTEANKQRSKCPKCANDSLSADRCCNVCGFSAEPPASRKERDRDLSSSLQSLLKETVTSDVKKRLEDAAKLNDIPATYAVPKTQDSDSDPFIMQPFIIEEPRGGDDDQGVVGGAPSVDKKFVPSLVFLPVKERLSRPLTASFTLTPA